jgi:Zn-dependent protease with chaperone function
MRFLAHIASAKWQTAWLVLLYAALVGIVAFTLALLVCIGYLLQSSSLVFEINLTLLKYTTAGIAVAMVAVAIYEAWRESSNGGMYVMDLLKGRNIYQTDAALEIRLNHVVDEVVLAAGAGCPRPMVYVFEDERCINAVTAGSFSSNLAIGVTMGALSLLNREQLQGLIAHELGHMLEEDTVVNQRLNAMTTSLRGLQILAEESFALNEVKLWPFACLVWIIGCLGALAGRILQAAVSRKREFLADAHAVRLTRNPQGLIGALQKIGAQNRIEPEDAKFVNRHALAIGHSFFDSVYIHQDSERVWFDTHPSLKGRIARLRQM